MRAAVRRHPVATYFVLTFAMSLPSPRLPRRARAASTASALSALIHAAIVLMFVLAATWLPANPAAQDAAIARPSPQRPRLVFLEMPGVPSGGGGGGNRRPAPPSVAQEVERDRRAVPVATPILAAETPAAAPNPHEMVLAARPLDAGTALLEGLPDASPSRPWPRGPGSGGGVGEGLGTGIGSGTGPGIGSGFGGKFGGGAYRPGSGVVAPTLLRQVLPKYTADALEGKVQGTVVLEVVVGREGAPIAIRVARSLDPGLDAEAMAAVREWRFTPGRLGDTPVDVLVTIWVDFRVV
jgi:protein TonB